MAFIYLDEEMREEAEKRGEELRRIVEKYKEWRKLHPERPEKFWDRVRDWWEFRQWKGQREEEIELEDGWEPSQRKGQREEEIELEDGWEPSQQQGVNVVADWVREFFSDIGFLILFLIFVLIVSIYLGQRVLFYILSLILLSIIVVNAHKFRRMIELLKGVF